MKLIINADDFGLTIPINQAIKELAMLGVISSTTVMVNMPCAYETENLITIKGLGIGLHFNLTQGKPVSNVCDIPTLVNQHGHFYSITELKYRIKKRMISSKDIFIELNAQYAHLQSLVGSNISHIDSHQDILKLGVINRALIQFSQKKKLLIGLRWYNKFFLTEKNSTFQLIEPSMLNISKFGMKRWFTEAYLRSRRKILLHNFKLADGMLYSTNNSFRTLLKQLIRTPAGYFNDYIFEVMVHPSTSTEGLSNTAMINARVEEYNILKSPEFQDFSKNNKLITFDEC